MAMDRPNLGPRATLAELAESCASRAFLDLLCCSQAVGITSKIYIHMYFQSCLVMSCLALLMCLSLGRSIGVWISNFRAILALPAVFAGLIIVAGGDAMVLAGELA